MAGTRLLHFSPAAVALFRWRDGALNLEARFERSDAGLAQFGAYTSRLKSAVLHVLIDVAEESFHLDTIPLVRGRDRKALLQRRLTQRFHDAALATAIPLGFLKTRRREERVLLAAFTNAYEIQPWLDALARAQVAVSGVYSPLLLAGLLARRLKLPPSRLLLVGAHGGSLRQHYIADGRAQFSRLILLRSEDLATPASTVATSGRETDRLWQYLRAQDPAIGDTPPDAVMIVPFQTERDHIATHAALRIELIGLPEAARRIGLKSAPPDTGVEALYLHVLATTRPRHRYAAEVLRTHYRARVWRTGLLAAGSTVCALCLLAAGLQLYRAHALQEQITSDREQLRLLEIQYDATARTLPPLPTALENLRAVLAQHEKIERSSREPHAFMAAVARALDRAPQIVLEGFDWKAESDETGEPYETFDLTASLSAVSPTDLRGIDELSRSLVQSLRREPGLEVADIRLPFSLESLQAGDAAGSTDDGVPRIQLKLKRKSGT